MAAVALLPFFVNPYWADYPVGLDGVPIVGRWIQPGERFSIGSSPDFMRDYYSAYVRVQPQVEEPVKEPVIEKPAELLGLLTKPVNGKRKGK